MDKIKYIEPAMELCLFTDADIITNSPTELPDEEFDW